MRSEVALCVCCYCFVFKQDTAYEMRISGWSSYVCSSDLPFHRRLVQQAPRLRQPRRSGAAVEQARPEEVLELAQGLAHGRLRHVERRGGLTQAAVALDGSKDAEQAQRREGGVHNITHRLY